MFKDYLKYNKQLSENTVKIYSDTIKGIESFLNRRLDCVEDVYEYLNSKELSPYSYNQKIASLKMYFEYIGAVGMETFKFKHIENNMDQEKFVKPEVIQTVIKSFNRNKEGIKKRLIFNLMLRLGLRVSEVINLKLSNINDDNSITFTRKGGKKHTLPVEVILKDLDDYLKIRYEFEPKTDNLIVNRFGKSITRQAIWKMFKKYNIHPHQLRHTLGKRLVDDNVNLRVVQKILNHKNISTTQIYTHVDNEAIKGVL
ncbi:MAG: tyrosine-type recombinase/integrase [Candidatus Pacebacteria bacterium]|nr:tyrosine-type recombinase/integrase [Candidatus Paceibacterota bacterium]